MIGRASLALLLALSACSKPAPAPSSAPAPSPSPAPAPAPAPSPAPTPAPAEPDDQPWTYDGDAIPVGEPLTPNTDPAGEVLFHADGRVAYAWVEPARSEDASPTWIGHIAALAALADATATAIGVEDETRDQWLAARRMEGFELPKAYLAATVGRPFGDDGYQLIGALGGTLRRWLVDVDTKDDGTLALRLASPDNRTTYPLGTLHGELEGKRKAALHEVALAPDGKTLFVVLALTTGDRGEVGRRYLAGAFTLSDALRAKAAEPLPPMPAPLVYDDGTPAPGEPLGALRAAACAHARETNRCHTSDCECAFTNHLEVGGAILRMVTVTATYSGPSPITGDADEFERAGFLLLETAKGWAFIDKPVVQQRVFGHSAVETTNTIVTHEVIDGAILKLDLTTKEGNSFDADERKLTRLCYGRDGVARCQDVVTAWRHEENGSAEEGDPLEQWERTLTLDDAVVRLSAAKGSGVDRKQLPKAAKLTLATLGEASEVSEAKLVPLAPLPE